MKIIKKNTKFDFDKLYICYTASKEKSIYGGFAYCSNAANVLIQDDDQLIEVVNYDKKGNAILNYFSTKQILSKRENEESSINGEDIDKYISEISKKEEYKDKEYSYITDIQRFDKFLQQFGIDISTLEKVTINEAKKIYSDYLYKRRIEIIKHYLGLSGETTFLAMTERLENEKTREIIKAIKEGSFVVTPEMFGLKKKSLLKRFFESIGNKKTLLNPSSEDLTERLKQPKGETVVPKVEVSTTELLENPTKKGEENLQKEENGQDKE